MVAIPGPMDDGARRGLRVRFAALPLHHRFALAGSVVALLGALVIGNMVGRSIETGVVRNSAISAAVYMESFIAPLSQELVAADRLSDGTVTRLEGLLTQPPFQDRILSVKIWRGGGLIAFASEPELIGQAFPPSPDLLAAWRGELHASFDDLTDPENAGERASGLPLLEVYNPIHSIETGEIIAVAEFYIVSEELAHDLAVARWRAWAVVAAVSGMTFLALWGIVRSGSRTIERQTDALTVQLRELARVNGQNQALRTRVQDASRRVSETNERYMRRVSAELHDGPAQALALASLRLDAVLRRASVNGDDPEAANLRVTLDEALTDVRNLCRGLTLPVLSGRGLGETLDMAVEAHERRTGVTIQRDLSDPALARRLPHPILICVYRFVQEALMNAYRHASGAPVRLEAGFGTEGLVVRVSDGGRGFDPEMTSGHGLGILGLQERVESIGGEFNLRTRPGAGTVLTLTLQPEALL